MKTTYTADDEIATVQLRAENIDDAKVEAIEEWKYAEPGTYEVLITGRDEDGQIVETETVTVTAR